MPAETINGTTIAYDVTGDGPPVVLVHGSWSSRETWALLVPHLAARFRVIAYDRRGHSESAGDPAAGTIHDDVADVAALIEALDAGPAHLVGNSLGCHVVLRLAATRPDVVSRVVCHEPGLLGLLASNEEDRELVAEDRETFAAVCAHIERGHPEAGARHFVEHALGLPWDQMPLPMRERMIRNAPTFLGEDRDPDACDIDRDTLARIAAPVLLTQGETGAPVFPRVIETIFPLLPNARRYTVPGAEHLPHVTHAEAYAQVVTRFLLDEGT